MSMEKLRAAYYGIYGENGITDFFYDQLVNIIATAKKKKKGYLKKEGQGG